MTKETGLDATKFPAMLLLSSQSIEDLMHFALTRNPPLSVFEHQKLALVCSVKSLENGDLSAAQSFLDDALRQAHALGIPEAIDRCLYWQAVLKYKRGDFLGCKVSCESLLGRSDLCLDLAGSICLLLSNTLPLLHDLPVSTQLTLPSRLSMASQILPEIPRESATRSSRSIADLAADHLRRSRTAFGLTYVARLAQALSSPEESPSSTADAAFLNVARHFEFRDDFLATYARTSGSEIPAKSQPLAEIASVASVIGRRVATTAALLQIGNPETLGAVSEDVIEAEADISVRMRFWAAKARGARDEDERFAAARKLALIADDVHDFRLLEEAVALASEFSGPQSVFYKELQGMLKKFDEKKAQEIYFLPANPPGLQNSGPSTPQASEAARRASRVSTGGMPALSPWKASLAELSP